MTDRLRIALQKKGRLADDSFALLKKCGLRFAIRGGGLLARVKNMPIDLLLVRDDDIPSFVANDAADIGIVGENVLVEEQLTSQDELNANITMRLGFSRCKLSLAAADTGKVQSVTDLNGTRIATTYPGVLGQYLRDNNIKAKLVEMKGAVELAPSIGIAESICDLVSSGATLEANGLTAFKTILESEAVLIQSGRELSAAKAALLDKLMRRIDGVIKSAETKYIMLNAPKDKVKAITELLPGSDSPTIIPLAGSDDLVALQAVCTENIFWETLEDLKALGARAILVLPIEKMMS
ncbi:ATP phosphoribosyltransferase [Litorimonas taeanensis]|uniref:ATP phosphoribosyltransferase n=2 Tax=Litorimonas taeanensis TaxID=568099 RepID=A0A420WK31_9PROT|nr:ATP phosphoribosyltransferase [Litorimonas taeanensis]RKQ71383.1 ATP phosphoribosyltransferase [Litorimonas taeanensis]